MILSEGAGLITQKVLDSAKFFRNRRIPGYSAFQLRVMVDIVGVDNLSEVYIDPERDRDHRTQ